MSEMIARLTAVLADRYRIEVLTAGIAVSRDPARFLAVRRVAAQEGEAGAVVLMDDWIAHAKRRSRP